MLETCPRERTVGRLRSHLPAAAVPLRSPVPRTAGNRREQPSAIPSVLRHSPFFADLMKGSEPATFHRGVRFELAFLRRFFALCGPFAASSRAYAIEYVRMSHPA
jgi:hypothetical protein